MFSKAVGFSCLLIATSANAALRNGRTGENPWDSDSESLSSPVGIVFSNPASERVEIAPEARGNADAGSSARAVVSDIAADAWSWRVIKDLSEDTVHDRRVAVRASAGILPFAPTVTPEELARLHRTVTDLREYTPFVEGGFPRENLNVTTHANFIADFFDSLQSLRTMGVPDPSIQKILDDKSLEANHTAYLNLSQALSFLGQQSQAIYNLLPAERRHENPIAVQNNTSLYALNVAADTTYQWTVNYFRMLKDVVSAGSPEEALPTFKAWLSTQELKMVPLLTVSKLRSLMENPSETIMESKPPKN